MRCSSAFLLIWPVLRCQVAVSASLGSGTLCEVGKAAGKAVGKAVDTIGDAGIDSGSWTVIVVKTP